MSAGVLLNLSNELGKSDKMRGLTEPLLLAYLIHRKTEQMHRQLLNLSVACIPHSQEDRTDAQTIIEPVCCLYTSFTGRQNRCTDNY